MTGSTELGERLDPEALRTLLARYFERMKEIIEHHGGTVEKFIGDAVMAVFGVPVVHEDDALRALRAAAEMAEALPALGVQGRIGVATGEVVAGTAERLATGDAVNVAARLQQAAQPGEILLGEDTLRLTRNAVDAGPLDPLELKGKAEPVPAYRLVGVRAEATPSRHLDAPMVGRETELRRLGDAFDQALLDRSCQLFTILGSAGVGKSRLAAEFLGSLDEALVVRGVCLPYGEGITYWPVVEVLKQLPDVTTDRVADERILCAHRLRAARRRRARRSRGPFASASRPWRRSARSSASSTICTGARRRSSTWSSTWPTSHATRRSCCSGWRGPSCSTDGRAGQGQGERDERPARAARPGRDRPRSSSGSPTSTPACARASARPPRAIRSTSRR